MNCQEKKEELTALKTLKRTYSNKTGICPLCGNANMIIEKDVRVPKVYGERDTTVEVAYPCPVCKGGADKRSEVLKSYSRIPYTLSNKRYESFNWNIYRNEKGEQLDLSKKRKLVEDLLKSYPEWKKEGMGLYIYSNTKGTGKTFLASVICNELMSVYGIKTRFQTVSELIEREKAANPNSSSLEERDPIQLLCNCELLVLDDIGQQKVGNEWLNKILFRIIDARMNQRLVTIYTGNCRVDSLEVDDRITERIQSTSLLINLPEFNVRTRESFNKNLEFLKKRGFTSE